MYGEPNTSKLAHSFSLLAMLRVWDVGEHYLGFQSPVMTKKEDEAGDLEKEGIGFSGG